MIDFNHVGEPDRFGGRSSLDANFLALTRTGGSDTQRLSLKGGWQLPFLGPGGGAYICLRPSGGMPITWTA